MRLIFCVREHTYDEIQMGHLLGFSAILGLDAISATANANGFTPLTAIARTYGWQRDQPRFDTISLVCKALGVKLEVQPDRESVIKNVVAKSNGSDPHLLKFFQPHFRKNFGRNTFPEIVAGQFNPRKTSL